MDLLIAFSLSAFGGLLLAQSRLSPKSWFRFGVFAPLLLLLAIQASKASPLLVAACGLVFALFSIVTSLLALRLPVIVSALLAASQSILWTIFALGASYLLPHPFLLAVVSIACFGTALNWLEWSVLPLWGTAQNFSCTFPINRLFIAMFGAAGGTWSVLFISAWFAKLPSDASSQNTPLLATAGVLLLAVIWAIERLANPPSPQTLRVGVFGWAGSEFDALISLNLKLTETVREASEQGAKILVTPEAAIHVENREAFRLSVQTLAAKYKIALAIGYFDSSRRENCIDLVDANGELQGRYVKNHLVPVFETYQAGKSEIALMEVEGIKVGGLICQDDNFPDIARKYSKAGAQLLVVPTNDWKNVKDLHFASHRWRALEFRFALARAASDGISSFIDPRGKVLNSIDHFSEGARLLVTDIPVGNGKPTIYARIGDIFPVLCGIFALGCLIFAR